MKDAQKSRVTLDHPDLGGRVRHNKIAQQSRRMVGGGATDSMLVQRAQLARQAQAARRVITADKVCDLETMSPRVRKQTKQTVAAPVELAPQANEAPIERAAVPQTPQKKRFNFNLKSFDKTNAIYAMAVMLFVIGMGVAVQGYLSNKKAGQQIAVLGEAVESVRNGQPNSVASSLPNEDEVSTYDIAQYKVAANKPRYFQAPTIGVGTTRVLETGLTPEGAIETPAGIYDTSWYNNSAEITDDKGAVFIVGHYMGPTEAGIFWRLKDLNPGDEVEIEQGDGTISKFRVVEKIDYDVSNVDMAKALAPVNPEKLGLNLMTCGGKWDVDSQQYDERTLIRTEKV